MNEDQPLSFAELIGKVERITQKPQHHYKDALKSKQLLKTAFNNRQQRHIQAQHTRQFQRPIGLHTLSLNLDNLPAPQFNALKNKHLNPHQIIDLHGIFVNDALRLLNDKLSERKNHRLQYWLIIHGKGNRSPSYDKAPLKNAVLDLLLHHPAVGAIHSMTDSDNRSGGVMIIVHRK